MGLAYANRGLALEQLVARSNEVYRLRQVGVIHKVPTAWIPLRGRNGKIVSAKVDKKASVDFLGHFLFPSGPLPLAFDAKEVSKGTRWPLSKLEEHQYEYLRDAALTGAAAFLLIGFWEPQQFFVLPFSELDVRWRSWKAGVGPASVKAGDTGMIETTFPDYLAPLAKTIFKGGVYGSVI